MTFPARARYWNSTLTSYVQSYVPHHTFDIVNLKRISALNLCKLNRGIYKFFFQAKINIKNIEYTSYISLFIIKFSTICKVLKCFEKFINLKTHLSKQTRFLWGGMKRYLVSLVNDKRKVSWNQEVEESKTSNCISQQKTRQWFRRRENFINRSFFRVVNKLIQNWFDFISFTIC